MINKIKNKRILQELLLLQLLESIKQGERLVPIHEVIAILAEEATISRISVRVKRVHAYLVKILHLQSIQGVTVELLVNFLTCNSHQLISGSKNVMMMMMIHTW